MSSNPSSSPSDRLSILARGESSESTNNTKFSPIARNRPFTPSSEKLPTLKQLENKLEAINKKSEMLGEMYLKKHSNRDGFTKVCT